MVDSTPSTVPVVYTVPVLAALVVGWPGFSVVGGEFTVSAASGCPTSSTTARFLMGNCTYNGLFRHTSNRSAFAVFSVFPDLVTSKLL